MEKNEKNRAKTTTKKRKAEDDTFNETKKKNVSKGEEADIKQKRSKVRLDEKVSLSDVKSKSLTKKNAKAKPVQSTLDKFNIKIPKQEDDKNFLGIEKNQELKIYSWNINGLRATMKKGLVEKFIASEQPDILCFNETKIDIATIREEKYEKNNFSDYLCYWNSSVDKAGYSGVGILTKYKPLSVTNGINHDAHDGEGRVLTLEFPTFFLISVYVPNAGEGLKRLDYRVNEWDVEFFNYLDTLKKQKNIILCGDLNVAYEEIDIYETKGHNKSAGFTIEERESFGCFLKRGYIDTFRHLYPEERKYSYFSARRITHKQENKGWRLDYFVINEDAEKNLIDSEILNEYEGSDHTPIKLTYKA